MVVGGTRAASPGGGRRQRVCGPQHGALHRGAAVPLLTPPAAPHSHSQPHCRDVAAAAGAQQQEWFGRLFQPKAAPAAAPRQQQQRAGRAQEVVRRFYDAYNVRDLATIESLIADDISYQ